MSSFVVNDVICKKGNLDIPYLVTKTTNEDDILIEMISEQKQQISHINAGMIKIGHLESINKPKEQLLGLKVRRNPFFWPHTHFPICKVHSNYCECPQAIGTIIRLLDETKDLVQVYFHDAPNSYVVIIDKPCMFVEVQDMPAVEASPAPVEEPLGVLKTPELNDTQKNIMSLICDTSLDLNIRGKLLPFLPESDADPNLVELVAHLSKVPKNKLAVYKKYIMSEMFADNALEGYYLVKDKYVEASSQNAVDLIKVFLLENRVVEAVELFEIFCEYANYHAKMAEYEALAENIIKSIVTSVDYKKIIEVVKHKIFFEKKASLIYLHMLMNDCEIDDTQLFLARKISYKYEQLVHIFPYFINPDRAIKMFALACLFDNKRVIANLLKNANLTTTDEKTWHITISYSIYEYLASQQDNNKDFLVTFLKKCKINCKNLNEVRPNNELRLDQYEQLVNKL